MPSKEDSQLSAGSTGVRDARKKASERLGEWVKGKYRLEKLLGVGGMASVYGVTHRNGSRAALKILHADFARDAPIKERFLREGYVANKVNHPGVVRILDDDETDHGEPYLMMELLEGETLRQLWKRNKRVVPTVQAIRIAAEILDALGPCHDAKVIHRDLKPANIFLCTNGVVKVLDFGVAQLREEGGEALTRAGTALGTPSYMAPEQAQGNSHNLDGRADIFSVGAILYTMMSGRRLLQGKSPNEAFILAATQPAPSIARSNPDLPVGVIALVDKALKWDRRKRFKDAAAMRRACEKVLNDLGEPEESILPITGSPPSSEPPPSSHPSPDSEPPRPTEPPTRGATPGARRRLPKRSGVPDIPLTQIGVAPEAAARGSQQARRERQRSTMPAPDGNALRHSRPARKQPPPPTPAPRTPAPRTPAPRTPAPRTPAPRTPQSGLPTPPPRERLRSESRSQRPNTPSDHTPPPPTPAPAYRRTSEPAPRTEDAFELSGSIPPTRAPREDGESPLVELFERFEKSLATLRQYGLDHPEGLARVRNVHQAFLDALQVRPDGIRFQVHPFCFTDGTTTVWEPGHPNDQVPYGLASSGVEEIQVAKGVSKEEIREFLQITIIDPQLGLTEGDIGGALWEAGFTHIACKVRDDLTDADAREQIRFFSESEEVEAEVRDDLAKVVDMMAQTARPNLRREDQAEAAAMAMTTDTEMFRAAQMASEVMRLDYAAAKALATELTLDAEEWRERFFDLSPQALADAAERGDIEIIWTELDLYTDRWIKGGQWSMLLDVYDQLITTLSRYARTEDTAVSADDITRRIFTWKRLAAMFGYLDGNPADPHVDAKLEEVLSNALGTLDDHMVSPMLRLADNLVAGPLCELALAYVGQHMGTRKQEILERLNDLRPELAQRVLAALTHDNTAENRELLKPLLMSPNPALRCEATALLAPSVEELGKQLVRLLASRDLRLRSAALTTMVRHDVRHAGPGLVQAIEDDSALERPESDLRQMFDTLYELHPSRAESLLIGIVSSHGIMSNEALDKKRALAADALGKHADSSNPMDALEGATRIRPWNTQALRSSAAEAISTLQHRLTERQAGAKP